LVLSDPIFENPTKQCCYFQCHRNGGDGIELDVEFTSDGIAVVLHDDTVDRTTDGSGKINEISFVEARRLNAAANHPKGHLAGFQVQLRQS
jgi:glycerophosphoryl diester phosphodiesterase